VTRRRNGPGKIPPTIGGVDLSPLKGRGPALRTKKEVTFQNVSLNLQVNTDEEGIVRQYELQFIDPAEATMYHYPFDTTIKLGLLEKLAALPEMGEKIGEVNDGPDAA
jgi:hypothetical protein